MNGLDLGWKLKVFRSFVYLNSILNSIFSGSEKEVDTGSVEDEKQETLDNLPGHLKIGKDFTMHFACKTLTPIVKSLPIFK